MSTTTAALIVLAALVVSLAGSYWLIYRARRRESVRDRIVREAREAHPKAYGPPPGPDPMDAGRERLWAAVRNEQQKEDHK